jgi:hypothetical protein
MTASGEKPGEDAPTFASVLAGARPGVKRCRVCMRGDLVDEIEGLQRDLEQAQVFDHTENRAPQAPKIAALIVEKTEEALTHEVEFVFRSIGRRAWRDLLAAHPPTEEDKKAGADFNRESFPQAAMAASCVAPTGATEKDFQALADGNAIGDPQWNQLWLTCRDANVGGAEVPLSVSAFGLVRGTAPNSKSRETTDSLAASS